MVRCSDNSLYTGITTNITRRLAEHNESNKGAAYTRSRRPVTIVFSENFPDRSAASRKERFIKKLSKAAKERLLLG